MDETSDLKARLVQAALDLFESEGVAPSLRAVARRVGISAMTPYSHFADKAALMSAVAEQGFKALAARLEEADRIDDPLEALVGQGMAMIAFAQANPALFRLIYDHEYGHARSELVERTYEVLRSRVASIIPSQVSAATLACRSLAQGLASILLDGRLPPSSTDDVEAALRLLVGGLAALAGRR